MYSELLCNCSYKFIMFHFKTGIKKNVKTISKMKECELAGEWKRSIVNHVYWAASSTQDGDSETIIAKYKSAFNHIRNVHEHDDPKYAKCEHGDNYPEREWMTAGKIMRVYIILDSKNCSPSNTVLD